MIKFEFTHRWEWSDFSEHSPSHWGQLPIAVILPDSNRIALHSGAIEAAEFEFFGPHGRRGKAWIPLGESGIKFRLTSHTAAATQRVGRGSERMEILAPKDTQFVFRRWCPHCGETSGEEVYDGDFSGRAELKYHEGCLAIIAEMEEEMERQRWQTVPAVAERLGIEYDTLVKAVREGRVYGQKSAGTWLTTVVEVEHAREEGRLRV